MHRVLDYRKIDPKIIQKLFWIDYLKVAYMEFRRAQITKSIVYLTGMKRILRDNFGILLLKGWKQLDKGSIVLVDDHVIPEILRIQSEEFQNKSEKDIVRHSKCSREIFYVIKNQNKVIGYCIYYLKPKISFKSFKRQAVIYSIATDRNFRCKGFAERLLKESIKEMKLNRISLIFFICKCE
ncbi:GNAT family N-acetyltransferase [Methanosarcina horonobensis]|uniref:GNAT family N-acetyltransferase n=1 Tax=Methanosarcina horonobensis TaxID=418008 RepID=UPI0022B86F86|nr:GNAT family N-acetyltransferase [Methanosarcina horonobensis]